ncbi:DUF6122 family protein [Flocculibacter collagenilyticus]|uniref:DUF6122 family protein n=1 Tax=Flocculibacter collagenilyticus TaxID=2744479 RepID=UPI0018F4E123|nr:DUF6122 family protein [Flocculibacter collagenilyticus]
MWEAFIHLVLHFVVPLLVALIIFRKQWRYAFIIMILTMVVDVDHLLATPIYDPLRCSIGFHPLHQWPFILLYAVMSIAPRFIPKFNLIRLMGTGLIIHMILDSIDCQMTNGIWYMT